ncbi:hypothetical protein CEE69_19310 [Rhodopirellula bahusiensis]|uniref:Uncharacterized protein n=1 Tax=Rhodopirellula bahusiensis TaxID=2014065 RepID=A0A2G1W3Z6_9BACT|nr:hypothetical protein CEE69_19310 [Rhodopirellula bahusiensis]
MKNDVGQHRPLPVPFGQAGSRAKLLVPRGSVSIHLSPSGKLEGFTPNCRLVGGECGGCFGAGGMCLGWQLANGLSVKDPWVTQDGSAIPLPSLAAGCEPSGLTNSKIQS